MIVRARRVRRLEAKRVSEFQRYRTPIQVCPRGCEFSEMARRNVLTRTEVWGRVALRIAFDFETTNCPRCGALLIRRCVRCKTELYAPVSERCQSCGFPQPWSAERRTGERALVRHWRPPERQQELSADAPRPALAPPVNDPARDLYTAEKRGTVWVIEGDITQLAVEAIVSDDDVQGRMWAQVAAAIKRAGGAEVERLAQVGRPFRLGHAWVTEAGDLPLKGIIHVASMDRHGESDPRFVRTSLTAALERATESGFGSIGVAAIGAGPAAIDRTDWFKIFAGVTVRHLRDLAHEPAEELAIVLVLFEPPDFEADVEALRRAMWNAWDKADRPGTGKPVESFDTLRARARLYVRRAKRAVATGIGARMSAYRRSR